MSFSDGIADFRSDTVTRPTPAMYEAMTNAELGDDVYHDDPTVLALEEESAAAVGKEAAVFVPTGTMGNQLAIMLHTKPGEEVLVNMESHLRSIERGAASAFSGVAFRTADRPGGRIEPEDIDKAMEFAGFFPRISLLTWENTHNLSGGRVIPLTTMERTSQRVREHGLKVHLDGARIWNAVAATGISGDKWAALTDTTMFSFSKGLGAPVGSIVCGDVDAVDEIRYLRGRMGGAMRQTGVLAAAARVGLSERDRLVDDHVLAQKLAVGVSEKLGDVVGTIETNIVNVGVQDSRLNWSEVSAALKGAGIKTNAPRGGVWRLVTHRDVDDSDVERLLNVIK